MSAKYRIVMVRFGERLDRLFRAFESSVRANCSDYDLRIVECEEPFVNGGNSTLIHNTLKLHVWREEVESSRIPVVCMDGDTVVLHDLFPAFSEQGGAWDVAVTERPHKCWLNGGVVFCRPTRAAKQFMRAWCRVNDDLLADGHAQREAFDRHFGINQTALVHALDTGMMPGVVAKLPCQKWNNCDQTWASVDDDTAVLHVKSALREHVYSFKPKDQWPEFLWRAREKFLPYDPDCERMEVSA
jgi:hypothetical protein